MSCALVYFPPCCGGDGGLNGSLRARRTRSGWRCPSATPDPNRAFSRDEDDDGGREYVGESPKTSEGGGGGGGALGLDEDEAAVAAAAAAADPS